MSKTILQKDIDLKFPSITIVRASAGSGKTHALTKRFIQFILSDKIPNNGFRNILAITFSNNAAKEMKKRILLWLKEIYFRREDKISEISEIVSINKERLVKKAGELIDEILLNYSDFQIKTIDSFMTSIYKYSAIDFGYRPDFEILMSKENPMTYAFHRFLKNIKSDSKEADLLENALRLIQEAKGAETGFIWDPSKAFLEEIIELYDKISSIIGDFEIPDFSSEINKLKNEISNTVRKIDIEIEKSKFKRNKMSSLVRILDAINKNNYRDLIGIRFKNPPVQGLKAREKNLKYKKLLTFWSKLEDLIKDYSKIFSFNYYIPYLKIYKIFEEILEKMKRDENLIFIEDINKKLYAYLKEDNIPDLYFRIGDTVYHYLIDEFQDTSLIQWLNLFPLIENSLSQGGSFFAVGDTKQAIYGFRNADYRIMKNLESNNPFPSSHHEVLELNVNFRSYENIVKFTQEFFQKIISYEDSYSEPARRSGLSNYLQQVKPEHEGKGHVEIIIYEKREEVPWEKEKLQILIKELLDRGYHYSDIAILTQKNNDVIRITTWLNEIEAPFISYSSLDIRKSKLTEEIIFLVRFLNSPPDNLAFSGFIMGEIFRKALSKDGLSIELKDIHDFIFRNRKQPNLYKRFQDEFPFLWRRYFDSLFRAIGFLPLYDLLNEIYSAFNVFGNFKEQEATIVKILEVIKDLESQGISSPADLLRLESNGIWIGEERWEVDVPEEIDAIKVMTIHKAKGLEFPVVILILYGEQKRGFKYVLSEKDGKIFLLKLTRDISRMDESLCKLYDEEGYMEFVNKLNLLYVAFTRPKFELYIIGICGKRDQFPINLLQKGIGLNFKGEKLKIVSKKFSSLDYIELLHSQRPLDLSPFSLTGDLSLKEKQRGEFFHRVLYFVEFLNEEIEKKLGDCINLLKDELNIECDIEKIKREILDFINNKDIKPYFIMKDGRRVLREQEFSDQKGNLVRMDRVIIDDQSVTVIDFKTGNERREKDKHLKQVKSYMDILKEIYKNKFVEGLIAYIDLKEIVRLN